MFILIADSQLSLYFFLSLQDYNVSLHRTSNKDKIGLTLCYGEPIDDEVCDVYVRSVDDDSLASRDGRIQEGDQILKVSADNF